MKNITMNHQSSLVDNNFFNVLNKEKAMPSEDGLREPWSTTYSAFVIHFSTARSVLVVAPPKRSYRPDFSRGTISQSLRLLKRFAPPRLSFQSMFCQQAIHSIMTVEIESTIQLSGNLRNHEPHSSDHKLTD
jgi:hypothetical protein